MNATHKRILCAWLPNWSIQRLVVAQPELRCQRIALFRRDARRGQIVSAASPLAMQGGVTVDMPLSEAKSLLRRATFGAPGARENPFFVFEHDEAADRQAMELLVDELENFSPIVGLETIDQKAQKQGRRPNSIFLDVTGLAHLFGDEQQLATRLILHLENLGYLPRVAVASTLGAAWAFARFFAGEHFRKHQQPLLATGHQETEWLNRLPVDALRLEPTIVDTLYQLGIRTMDQLRRLSRDDLAMRFGNVIHRRIDQLTGVLEEPVIARQKPSEFIAEQLLEFPTHHRETIEAVIERLATDLGQQMRAKQQGALQWHVRLGCQTGRPIEFQVNLFQPTATVEHIMPLIEMQLERALSPVTRKVRRRARRRSSPTPAQAAHRSGSTQTRPTADSSGNESTIHFRPDPTFHRFTTIEVTEVTLTVSSYVLLAQQQRKLFDENPRLDRQALSHLINRLASRLGAANVVYPTLQSGAQPEYSYRFKPLVDARRRQRRKVAKAKSESHLLARPVRLLRPPLPLDTFVATQDSQASCLEVLSLQAQDRYASESFSPQRVVASCGPQRIETGWWRGRTVCRDYWRVETETGQHYWVYRDLRTRRWWLHGVF
ncbi:MAG: DNA polymerase Y family protein [Planctomycetota bacterium]